MEDVVEVHWVVDPLAVVGRRGALGGVQFEEEAFVGFRGKEAVVHLVHQHEVAEEGKDQSDEDHEHEDLEETCDGDKD